MAVHGVAKSRTRLSNFTFTFHFHALEKERATHSSVLAWRISGTGESGGLLSMGCTTEVTQQQQCKMKIQVPTDFPGGPVVKTSPSNTWGVGLMPGQGAKISHTLQPKKPKHNTEVILYQIR